MPNSMSEYTVLLARDLDYAAWLELVRTCTKVGISVYSTPAEPIRWNVFVREEDKDLLED